MATVLDVGLLNYFSVLYPMIVVWCIVFAILSKTKAIGTSAGINATVAVAFAFMTILSKTITDLINFMIPWFAVAIIFFILMILLFQLFGAKEASIEAAIHDKGMMWAIIGVGLLIMVAGFGSIMGQSLTDASSGTPTSTVTTINEVVTLENGSTYTLPKDTTSVASGNFESDVTATLFNPKVLGMIILFAVAIFAVALLSSG